MQCLSPRSSLTAVRHIRTSRLSVVRARQWLLEWVGVRPEMQIWKPGLQPYQSSVYSVQLRSITVLYAKPSDVRSASFGGHWYKKDGGCHRIEPCDTRKDSGHSTDMLQVKNRVFDCVGRVISIDTYNFWCLFVSVMSWGGLITSRFNASCKGRSPIYRWW